MSSNERYEFDFFEGSTYERANKLVVDHTQPGAVISLGCGYGSGAERLRDIGYSYIGFDVEQAGLDSLRQRGFETHHVDLNDSSALEVVCSKLDGRPLSAVLALDILEHLRSPDTLVHALKEMCEQNQALLITSIPNVAHNDVAAKLLSGRWDISDVGLLDATHVSHFTFGRMKQLFSAAGFVEIASSDIVTEKSEQHHPEGLAFIDQRSALGQALAWARSLGDDHQFTYQFLRAWQPISQAPKATTDDPHQANPSGSQFAASVIVRTQGKRLDNLEEALVCLAAQTRSDFEVLVMLHRASHLATDIRDLIESFDQSFSSRVALHEVNEGGRARPLSVGIDSAVGEMICFLDDDDLVTADWIENYANSGNATVVRAQCANQQVKRLTDNSYQKVGRPQWEYELTFDLATHLRHNQSPICSYAIPKSAFRYLGLKLDETLEVLEDYDLLMNAATLVGVISVPETTSIYHWWIRTDEGTSESSLSTTDRQVWTDAHKTVVDKLDARPLIMSKGWATELQNTVPIEVMHDEIHKAVRDAQIRAEAYRLQTQEILNSRAWRITRPIRAVGSLVKRLLGQS